MEYRKFDKTWLLRLDPGEEIMEQLKIFAEREGIRLAKVEGIGAVKEFTVGAFDTAEKQFCGNDFRGTYEIVSLLGTVTTKDGVFYSHLHMCAADKTGQTMGGHLSRAVISATGEIAVTELPGTVERQFSEEIGLNLFKF